jgi:hypothetical protein
MGSTPIWGTTLFLGDDMTDGKDFIGHFHIPDHLIRLAQSQAVQAPQPESPVEQVSSYLDRFDFVMWKSVKTFPSSNNKSIHTVSVRKQRYPFGKKNTPSSKAEYLEYKCTCQAFRIQKKGHCKHTDAVKAEIEKK